MQWDPNRINNKKFDNQLDGKARLIKSKTRYKCSIYDVCLWVDGLK